jgi:cyclic dehypoxanthinyl futalosine synthase
MIEIIKEKVAKRERLTRDECRWCLSAEPDLWELGRMAHQARTLRLPAVRATYQVDRNINYTNVCVTPCRFCAFSRPPGHPEAWTLSIDQIIEKVRETVDAGGTGILLQGGHNPEIPFQYYLDLLNRIRLDFPTVHIHAFSPPEIVAFSRFFEKPVGEILRKLISAGLSSLPGGGAEILTEPTRSRIAPGKCTGDEWLKVMRTCHRLGLKTTATMVIGFGETIEERLEHLLSLRDLQDETGGFTAFIPWTFQSAHTEMEGEVEAVGGIEYLRLQAASRLILDNVLHHQVSWVTQGLRLGSLALHFGADDFSSVMMEENVVAAAGTVRSTNVGEMCSIIRAAGFEPVKRLTLYQNILHA